MQVKKHRKGKPLAETLPMRLPESSTIALWRLWFAVLNTPPPWKANGYDVLTGSAKELGNIFKGYIAEVKAAHGL